MPVDSRDLKKNIRRYRMIGSVDGGQPIEWMLKNRNINVEGGHWSLFVKSPMINKDKFLKVAGRSNKTDGYGCFEWKIWDPESEIWCRFMDDDVAMNFRNQSEDESKRSLVPASVHTVFI